MLSLGSIAIDENGKIHGKFYKKLKPLENAEEDPKTMEFWEKNKENYKEATTNQEDPEKVMMAYKNWIEKIREETNTELIFLAYPVSYDYTFVYWYLMKFLKENPFKSIAALDIRSFVMAHLKVNFKETKKDLMPKKWFNNIEKHSHNALEDALEQAQLFINILKENREKWTPDL